MGWTATYASDQTTLTDDLVRNISSYMVYSGLAASGYKYVSLGDAWMNAKRETNGTLLADPARFPQGINGLSTNVT
jgi:alpha-galactosidase